MLIVFIVVTGFIILLTGNSGRQDTKSIPVRSPPDNPREYYFQNGGVNRFMDR